MKILRGVVFSAFLVFLASAQSIPEFDNCAGKGPSANDLVNLPNKANLANFLAAKFQDKILEVNFEKQLTKLIGESSKAIGKNKLGYLLEVEYYLASDGMTVIVPGGQLIFSIGLGTEPLDALAEYRRKAVIKPSHPANAENYSYHLWLTKDANEKLKFDSIPCSSSKTLLANALAEAKQRNLEAAFFRSVPDDYISKIQRADFWQKVVSERAQFLKDQARRLRIQAINEEMARLQVDMNKQYDLFQRLINEYNRQQQYLNTLNTIKSITDIIGSGIQAASLLSSSGSKASQAGASTNDLNSTRTATQDAVKVVAERHELTRVELEPKLEAFKKLEVEAKSIFKQEEVTIPESQSLGIQLPPLR